MIQSQIDFYYKQQRLADPNFKHKLECIEATQHYKRELNEWKARWPKYCRICQGFGSIFYCDDVEACEDCSAKNLCARCEASLGINGLWPCSECDFDGDPGLPDEPECRCLDKQV